MSESIFPVFSDEGSPENNKDLPVFKEIAWDFRKNIPLIENGNFKILSENEALKVWCFKALNVARFKYPIYSWDYGTELNDLIGKQYSPAIAKSECERFVTESLMINPYIVGVNGVESVFSDGKLTISCILETVYGEMKLKGVNVGV